MSNKECAVDGCFRAVRALGYCSAHYMRLKKNGSVGPVEIEPRLSKNYKCSVDGCDRKRVRASYCGAHYRRWEKTGDPGPVEIRKQVRGQCSVEGCERLTDARGYCKAHYERWKKNGEPGSSEIKKYSPYYSNLHTDYLGRTWSVSRPAGNSYQVASIKGSGKSGKQVGFHRIVMQDILGRELMPGENVHHINGKRYDNRPENLELWSSSQPKGQRVEDKLRWAREIIAIYGGGNE